MIYEDDANFLDKLKVIYNHYSKDALKRAYSKIKIKAQCIFDELEGNHANAWHINQNGTYMQLMQRSRIISKILKEKYNISLDVDKNDMNLT